MRVSFFSYTRNFVFISASSAYSRTHSNYSPLIYPQYTAFFHLHVISIANPRIDVILAIDQKQLSVNDFCHSWRSWGGSRILCNQKLESNAMWLRFSYRTYCYVKVISIQILYLPMIVFSFHLFIYSDRDYVYKDIHEYLYIFIAKYAYRYVFICT